MAKGYNIDMRKKSKRNLILNIIRNNKHISKSKVKSISKLSMATVLQNIDQLINDKLVFESGIGQSTGGRRPTWLQINPKGGYFIGVEFNADMVSGAILNLIGEVVYLNSFKTDKPDPQAVMEKVKECIRQMLSHIGKDGAVIWGIGIGAPGFIDRTLGTSFGYVHLHDWNNVEIKNIIMNEFGIKTYVEQNVNAIALAFKWYNRDEKIKNILVVSIRTGVGMGCILNGELYSGHNGMTGEIGHNFIRDNNEHCLCGRIGCLDTEVGYSAIKRKIISGLNDGRFEYIRRNIGDDKSRIDINLFVAAVENDDPDAIELLKSVCKDISTAVDNAINILNPDKIIFSGELTRAKGFLAYLKTEINNYCLQWASQNLIVECSEHGDKVGSIGAATIVMNKEFGLTHEII